MYYIRVNKKNMIIRVFTATMENPKKDDIEIDRNSLDILRDIPLGRDVVSNFKYVDGEIVNIIEPEKPNQKTTDAIEKEKLIQDEIRSMSIQTLIEKGVLDQDGNLIK